MKGAYRYLIVTADKVQNLEDSLVKAVTELWGLRGLATVEVSVVEVKESERLAIIKVKREGLALFRAAIAVHPKPLVRILKVTGTLRKAREIQGSIASNAKKR